MLVGCDFFSSREKKPSKRDDDERKIIGIAGGHLIYQIDHTINKFQSILINTINEQKTIEKLHIKWRLLSDNFWKFGQLK